MTPEIHFAPLQGYADQYFRRFHARLYGGTDTYYTPFIRVEKGAVRRQDISRLKASLDDGLPIVAQIIFNTADEFRLLTDEVHAAGCHRIDLNLGCPFPMQTGKGRGAAMTGNAAVMSEIAAMISADTSTAYSVKMRLGMKESDEWKAIMPILNAMPLTHVTLHPRVAAQQYGGELHMDSFSEFVEASANPVIFNGDIHTPADIDRILAEYPTLKGVMIGRGMLARPSLGCEWREGKEWTPEQRAERLMEMHSLLFDAYCDTLCGATQILQKIKPFWEYLEPQIGRKAHKAIRKASTLDRYRAAVSAVDFTLEDRDRAEDQETDC